MDESDRTQHLAWLSMHTVSMREGLLESAARAVQRMDSEALENKVLYANKPYFGAFVFPSPSGGYSSAV